MSKFDSETGDLEPLTVTIEEAERLTGESRSQIYNRLGRGEYDAVKSGSRTLILYASVKRWLASLPPAKVKAPRARSRPRHAQDNAQPRVTCDPKVDQERSAQPGLQGQKKAHGQMATVVAPSDAGAGKKDGRSDACTEAAEASKEKRGTDKPAGASSQGFRR